MKTRTLSRLAASLLPFVSVSISFASPLDVHGKGDSYIKVTRSRDQGAASFELCSIASNSCSPLGKADSNGRASFYRLSDLRDQRGTENAQFVGSILADAAIGTVLVLSGGGIAALLTSATLDGAASGGAVAVGAVAGAGTTTAIAHFSSPLNPVEQHRQARILGDDVIADQDVTVNQSIEKLAGSLNTVLAKLTPEASGE